MARSVLTRAKCREGRRGNIGARGGAARYDLPMG